MCISKYKEIPKVRNNQLKIKKPESSPIAPVNSYDHHSAISINVYPLGPWEVE